MTRKRGYPRLSEPSTEPLQSCDRSRVFNTNLWITAIFVVFSGSKMKKPHGIWPKILLFHNQQV